MTMRRLGPVNWRNWVRDHGDVVLGLGLPGDLLRAPRRWTYFLEHGYDHESGWKPDLLPAGQRRLLAAYLKSHVPAVERTGLTEFIASLTQ